MIHPDQERWDAKHRRRLDRDQPPSPHDWMEPMVRDWSGPWILDLACGPGVNLGIGVSEGRGHYGAVEISPVALRATRQRYEECRMHNGPGRRLVLVQADLEETFPFRPIRALYIITYFYSPFLFETVAREAPTGSQVLIETFCALGEDAPINPQYCLEPGELRRYFETWDRRLDEERTGDHPETARLWAVKP